MVPQKVTRNIFQPIFGGAAERTRNDGDGDDDDDDDDDGDDDDDDDDFDAERHRTTNDEWRQRRRSRHRAQINSDLIELNFFRSEIFLAAFPRRTLESTVSRRERWALPDFSKVVRLHSLKQYCLEKKSM